jgi:hypothetical protein
MQGLYKKMVIKINCACFMLQLIRMQIFYKIGHFVYSSKKQLKGSMHVINLAGFPGG